MRRFFGGLVLILLLGGCAIDRWAVNKMADMLSADNGSLVFVGDDDPQLVGDALPFAIKLYESLLESAPEHQQLLLATGKAYCLYAFAFVQTPAAYLEEDQYKLQGKMTLRAKKLFLRGRGYIFKALFLKNPGFQESLEQAPTDMPAYRDALGRMDESDVPYLYWGASAWMGAFSTDVFDMDMLMSTPRAIAMLDRVLELNGGYDRGGVHEIFTSYYGALPESSGGSEERAREHYRRALEFSGGKKASTYMALATSVCMSYQYIEEFKELMNTIIEMDLDESPEDRLLNEVTREKALWYMDNLEIFFFIDSSEDFEADSWNEEEY